MSAKFWCQQNPVVVVVVTKPTVDAVEVIVESAEVIVVVNGIDVVVSVDTLTVRRAVEAEAVSKFEPSSKSAWSSEQIVSLGVV